MLIYVLISLLTLIPGHFGQKISPCPDVFSYDQTNRDQGRWYGLITLKTEDDLEGISVAISLDNSADSLGNWFGHSTTRNNKDFMIQKHDYHLLPGNTTILKFYVKFNAALPIPYLQKIRLNGKLICPSSKKLSPLRRVIEPSTIRVPDDEIMPIDVREEPTFNVRDDEILPIDVREEPIFKVPDDEILPIAVKGDDIFGGDYSVLKNNSNQTPFLLPPPPCGTISDKIAPLITGGFSTSAGQFPWHIAIYASATDKLLKYTCGGTLINSQYVVTAAHCVAGRNKKTLVNLQRFQIYLGTSNLVLFDSGIQIRQISEGKIHPDYNPTYYYNDIALLKLITPVDITDYVRPICLWESDVDISKLYGKPGLVVGWGEDAKNVLSDTLKGVNVPIVRKEDCIYSNRNFFSMVTFQKNYCAGYRNGTSVCNGDSGGGMFFPKSQSPDGNSKTWQLRGIVSLSVALQGGSCNPNHYIVFTDAAQYLDWIRSNMHMTYWAIQARSND